MKSPYNALTHDPYAGKNIDRLQEVCDEHGWTEPAFVTYIQAQKLGGQVAKGEHGTAIQTRPKTSNYTDDDGVEKTRTFGGKWKKVFHVSQCSLSA